MSLDSTFLQSLLSLDFDIDRVGLYLMNCMKLLTQAAWGHLGLHYAKKTSGKEPKLADPYGGCPPAGSALKKDTAYAIRCGSEDKKGQL